MVEALQVMKLTVFTAAVTLAAMVGEFVARRAGSADLGSYWYMILLSVAASAVGVMAVNRGRSRIGFGLLSFLFTSPVALTCLSVYASGPKQQRARGGRRRPGNMIPVPA